MTNILFAQYDSIPFGGYDRTYLVHLPTGYTGTTELPLIIAMHGGFGNAFNLENQSQLSAKADAENFIVVYPEGVKGGFLNIRTWNGGDCCGFASTNNIDDVGFIDSLLNTLTNQYAIDTNRIYATGISNGGFMSYRLACELSDRIAAIAPVASSMTMDVCNPTRPIPIIQFHSYFDSNIPHLGGVGSGFSSHYNPPIDSVLNVWSNSNSCSTINDTIINNSQYTFKKWTNCNCSSKIHYYITQDGGHSWPGGVQTTTGDPTSSFINANNLMWDFFQQHTLNCNPLAIENEHLENSLIEIYPNPTSGKLKIISTITYQKIIVSVFTISGQKLLTIKNQEEIDIRNLSKGTYFMLIDIDGSNVMKKIIKTE
jgi:polyhydroxybutyrate depolymerase